MREILINEIKPVKLVSINEKGLVEVECFEMVGKV